MNEEEPSSTEETQHLSSSVLKQLVFLPWLQFPPLPRVPDLSDPSKYGLSDEGGQEEPCFASHLFISSPIGTKESNSRIGAWLLLPKTSSGKVELLSPSDTVVLYLHGNSSNRSQPHRVSLYRIFLRLGYHVLALDYRGFGDSSPVSLSGLTEDSVVADARAGLEWVTSKLGDKAQVILWGHSLGSAIATKMVADFDLETGGNSSVAGLVLEAPFNNMLAEVLTYRAARALQAYVGLNVESVLAEANIRFESDKWLPAVRCPTLLLHAEDDGVVPYSLGQELYNSAREAGKTNLRMVTYPSSLGLGHCDIYTAQSLPEEIAEFVQQCTVHS